MQNCLTVHIEKLLPNNFEIIYKYEHFVGIEIC